MSNHIEQVPPAPSATLVPMGERREVSRDALVSIRLRTCVAVLWPSSSEKYTILHLTPEDAAQELRTLAKSLERGTIPSLRLLAKPVEALSAHDVWKRATPLSPARARAFARLFAHRQV